MLWIGITGDIGSGKSTVSDILRQKGYPVLDADKIVHELYKLDQSLISQIKKHFGSDVMDGERIDRKVLFKKIQKDPKKRETLEAMVHPKVKEYVKRWKKKNEEAYYLFYEVPLLFEKSLQEEFDVILYVHTDRDISLQRLKENKQWTETEIQVRRKWLTDPQDKKKKASYIIENNSDKKDLLNQVEKFLDSLPRKN